MARPARRIVEILGGKTTLGSLPASELEIVELVRQGLPARSLQAAVRETDLSVQEFSNSLRLPVRTLWRRVKQKGGWLTSVESERVFRLARAAAKAEEVLGDGAGEWLRRPSRALGGRTPLSLLDTDVGSQSVLDELGRIEHGVFS